MFYRPYSFVVTVARIYCVYNFGCKKKSLLCFFFRTRGSCGICQGIIFFLEREREREECLFVDFFGRQFEEVFASFSIF